MANGVNKAILIGNLGADPDYGVSQNNRPKCVINIATTEKWKDKQTGQMNEETDWHRVVFFNRHAEICRDYLRKGSKVYVEGKNKTRSWVDNATGQKRYMHEIVGLSMQMLDGQSKQNDGAYEPPVRQNSNGTQTSYSAPPPNYDDLDDDIPF